MTFTQTSTITEVPTLAITSPSSGSYINLSNQGSFTVSGTCSGKETTVTVKIDSSTTLGTAKCASSSWSLTGLVMTAYYEIEHTITADLSDTTGAILAQAKVSVTKDTTPPPLPTSWSLAPSSGSTSNVTVPTLTYVESEIGASIKIYSDGGCNTDEIAISTVTTNTSTSFTTSQMSVDGIKKFFFKVFDQAGNSTGCTSTGQSYTLDLSPPTISITTPNNSYVNAANASSVAVSGACSENTRAVTLSGSFGTVSATCGATTTGYWSAPLNLSALSDGTVPVTTTHTDAAGNSASHSITLNKDTVAPTSATVAATSASWNGYSYYFTGAPTATWTKGTDGGSGFRDETLLLYSASGCTGSPATYTGIPAGGTKTFSGLTNGTTYSYKITTYDNAANASTASGCSADMLIDTTTPTAGTVASTSASWNGQSYSTTGAPTATWTQGTAGPSGFKDETLLLYPGSGCTGSPATYTGIPAGGTKTFSGLTNGTTYSYKITTYNNAGNASMVSGCSANMLIDTAPPNAATSLGWVQTSPYNSTSVTASWTKSNSGDLVTQQIQFYSDASCTSTSGSLINLGSATAQTQAFAGANGTTYAYKVTSLDAAGNSALSACSSSMLIDTTFPTSATVAATSASWNGYSYNFTGAPTATWTKGTDGGSGFRDETLTLYSGSGCTGGTTAYTAITAGSKTFSGLSNGTTYSYKITTYDNAANASTASGCSADMLIDTTEPTVTSVDSSTNNGSYRAGQSISIQVRFSENVFVDGTPTLALNSGATVDYASGSGTPTLTFNYTIGSGQNSIDLDYSAINSLTAGTSIKDAAGNNAALTLPNPGEANSLGNNKAIVIDTTAPVTNIAWTFSLTTGDHSTVANPQLIATGGESNSFLRLYSDASCTNLVLGPTQITGTTTTLLPTLFGDGLKEFSYTLTDAAGNITACTSTALSYTLDRTAPTNAFVKINDTDPDGNMDTTSLNVNLSLGATETLSTPLQMCVKEEAAPATCTACTGYDTTAPTSFTFTGAYGMKHVSAQFKDGAGNVTCRAASIAYDNYRILPLYSAAPKWNDYVWTASITTPCTGSETGVTACIHGGEHRRVKTSDSTCTGLYLTDSLNLFDWTCNIVNSFAEFHSTLKTGKSLSDLINASGIDWKPNSINLTGGSTPGASVLRAWWQNPVKHLPTNIDLDDPTDGVLDTVTLNSPSTIYTLSSSATTAGYNINADKIGVVILSGSRLSWNGTTQSNFKSTDGETTGTNTSSGSNDSRAVLSAGTQNFLWIEGEIHGGTTNKPQFGVFLSKVKHSQLRKLNVAKADQIGVNLDQSSSNFLKAIRTADNGTQGVYFDNSSNNVLDQLRTYNNGQDGIRLSGSTANSFVGLISNNNGYDGIGLYATSTDNTIVNLTTASNASGTTTIFGIYLTNSENNFIHNVVTMNNYSAGLDVANSNGNTISQFAASNNGAKDIALSSSSTKFTGNVLVETNSECSVSSSTGLTGSCVASGSSQATISAPGTARPLLSSFVGNAGADTVNTATTGSAEYSTLLDWFNFENIFRAWGLFYSTPGRCTSGNCYILDWSLKSTDYVLRNTSGAGTAANSNFFVANANCPGEANGNRVIYDKGCSSGAYNQSTCTNPYIWTTPTRVYLQNAVEILGDEIGNDDGLCEQKENCLYTPNFGAYQGSGVFGECNFIPNGGLTEIRMFGYSVNGI